MAQNKKQFKLHSIKLDAELTKRLEAFCKNTGLTKTAVIERGISQYMDIYDALLTLPMAQDKYKLIIDTYKFPPLTMREQEAQRKGDDNED